MIGVPVAVVPDVGALNAAAAVVYPDPAAVIDTPPTLPDERTGVKMADVDDPPPENANCTTSPGK
jgi:hypothetical protein